MAQTIIMPQLGETVAEGKILEWFKTVGDDVKIGDRLFSLAQVRKHHTAYEICEWLIWIKLYRHIKIGARQNI